MLHFSGPKETEQKSASISTISRLICVRFSSSLFLIISLSTLSYPKLHFVIVRPSTPQDRRLHITNATTCRSLRCLVSFFSFSFSRLNSSHEAFLAPLCSSSMVILSSYQTKSLNYVEENGAKTPHVLCQGLDLVDVLLFCIKFYFYFLMDSLRPYFVQATIVLFLVFLLIYFHIFMSRKNSIDS